MPSLGRWLLRLWASPATLVGLAAALPALASGATARVVDGTIEVAGGGVRAGVMRLPYRCRFAAITLGHVVVGLDHATLAAIRAHERVHVRQYERWGVLFFPAYLASSAIAYARGRHPYFDNRFEREAFALGDVAPSARAARIDTR